MTSLDLLISVTGLTALVTAAAASPQATTPKITTTPTATQEVKSANIDWVDAYGYYVPTKGTFLLVPYRNEEGC